MNTLDSAQPFDVGLQLERTALAWRRTSLAFGVATLAGMRVLAESIGAWALVPGFACLILMGVVMLLAHRRYSSIHRHLTSAAETPRREWFALHLLCAGLAFVLGVVALSIVLYDAIFRP
jgi:uncharacterized membrane protein YidH (DUF202 family)